MLRRLLALAIMIAAGIWMSACAPKVAPEESCSFLQSTDQQRVSWGAQLPVILYIDSSVPTVYFDSIKAAAAEWNRVIGREVLKIGGWTNSPGGPKTDNANVIYYLTSWELDRTNEQARTTVYWAGDRIYEADVRINGKNFDFSWGEDRAPGRVDMESLMVHEFGHVLGLMHIDPPAKSVMERSLPSAAFRRSVTEVDKKSIRCEY